MKTISKIIILLLSMCLSFFSYATDLPRVVFLSSFKEETKIENIRTFYEENLKEHFDDNNYQVFIKTNADKYDLWEALHSKKNIAVFWVGHANAAIIGNGTSIGGDVLDVSGANISNYFKNISPNILWIGLVGCNTANMIKRNRAQGYYEDNPNLFIDSFDTKVELRFGVSSSIQKAADYIKNMPGDFFQQLSPREVDGVRVKILRKIPENANTNQLTSVSIEHKGLTITVFPQGNPGEIQQKEVIIPRSDTRNDNDYNLTVTTGRKTEITGATIPALGIFNINSEDSNLEWEPAKLPSGKIIGLNLNVYYVKKK